MTGRRYPYIVVRIMSAVYQREEITIRRGPPAVSVGYRSSFVQQPEPYQKNGDLTQGCRDLIVCGVLDAVGCTGFRMCLVWGPDSCTFCEKDGSANDSNEPPSGGFGSGGVGGTTLPIAIEFDRRVYLASAIGIGQNGKPH